MTVPIRTLSEGSPFYGPEGDLVLIRILVGPRELEDLLDALCEVSFPVNPQIWHAGHDGAPPGRTVVEFPAFEHRVDEVRQVLKRRGFDPDDCRVVLMADALFAAKSIPAEHK